MHYVGRRASETNPLRSIPLFRPASAVFRTTTPRQGAEWALQVARQELSQAEGYYSYARTALGKANRTRAAVRHARQAHAFRTLNTARAELRAARAKLAKAEAALAALDAEPAQVAADARPAPQRYNGAPARPLVQPVAVAIVQPVQAAA